MPASQAIVLAGHGSHHDPRAAAPVRAHADRIRERGHFDAVRAAFWKEQPSLAEVLATVEAETTYVVPLMTSEGYFTDRVFPRELGLEGGPVAGRDVRYTAPVGTHERLVDVVLDRVDAVLDGAVDERVVGLALVGHGTECHERSAAATVTQAARLRSLDRFAAVEPLFLDQAPPVADLPDTFDVDDVVVVPYFVADGGHVRRDVPSALGLAAEGEPFGGPWPMAGTRVWYARAVGTAPGVTDVILERAAEAGAETGARRDAAPAGVTAAERAFGRWLDGDGSSLVDGPAAPSGAAGATREWGELAVTVVSAGDGGPRYEIRHRDDRGLPAADLVRLATPAAVRAYTGTDTRGDHRPLRTARDLPRGWLAEASDRKGIVQLVRAVYPASVDHWYRDRAETLEATGFESVAERQAGRYRDLEALDPPVLAATVEAICGDCVRRRAWSAEGVPEPAGGEFPCPEPCSVILEAARSFGDADRARPEAAPVDPSVPPAAFDREGNRYRTRFRRAMAEQRDDRASPEPTP